MGEDFLKRSPFGFCPNSGDFSVDSVHKRLFLTPVTGEIFERQKVPNLIWRSWSELVDSYSWVYKSHKNQRNPISVYLTCRAGGHLANMPTIDIQCNLIWGSIKYKLLDGHLWNITQRNHEKYLYLKRYVWHCDITSGYEFLASRVLWRANWDNCRLEQNWANCGVIAQEKETKKSLLKKKKQSRGTLAREWILILQFWESNKSKGKTKTKNNNTKKTKT